MTELLNPLRNKVILNDQYNIIQDQTKTSSSIVFFRIAAADVGRKTLRGSRKADAVGRASLITASFL